MNGHGLPEPAMQLWRDYGDLLRRELGPLAARGRRLFAEPACSGSLAMSD